MYLNLIHAVVISTFQYSIPVMPFVIIFSAYGLLAWHRVDALARRFSSTAPGAVER
jgi:hypothetical protein